MLIWPTSTAFVAKAIRNHEKMRICKTDVAQYHVLLIEQAAAKKLGSVYLMLKEVPATNTGQGLGGGCPTSWALPMDILVWRSRSDWKSTPTSKFPELSQSPQARLFFNKPTKPLTPVYRINRLSMPVSSQSQFILTVPKTFTIFPHNVVFIRVCDEDTCFLAFTRTSKSVLFNPVLMMY